ncbi:beta-glucosidase [Microdochium nivale]|nr:beta-glucosidase [Microdochium nivale]
MPKLSSLSLVALLGATCVSADTLARRDPVPAGYVANPYYPTPFGGWADDWSESYKKAVALVSRMTLAEKTNITAGTGQFMGRCVANTGSADRVGFPQLCIQDGPLGVRTTGNVTAFPAGITTGATFNKKLMYERGVAIGQEFKGKGAHVYLGPSVGPLGRKPRGGRNWEGFGSDPVLQGVAGAQTIRGVQEQGVIATIKHLIANEQELYRMYNPFQQAYSANLDDRTMHELYLWPFADGMREGVGSVMTSYNDLNGSATHQNSMLLNGILKDELGFQGFVMTDWLSHLSGVGSALAGLDLTMPGDTLANAIPLTGYSHWMYELSRSVLNGSVPVDRLNDMCTRIVATWYKLGQDKDYPKVNYHAWVGSAQGSLYPGALFSPSGLVNEFVDVQADHAKVAKQVAQEAITLLKNNGSFLPLSSSVPIRTFGSGARGDPQGINSCADQSCNRGTLTMGWGSGAATLPYLDDPITSLRRKAGNVTMYDSNNFPRLPKPASEEVAIVFISSDSGENTYTVEGNHGDRDATGLAAYFNGDELVRKAAEAYSNVVVVYHTVGTVDVESWIDLPSVKAVLIAHLPGQEAGDSLTEILFGEASPSGKLPYTIAKSENDYPRSLSLVGTAFSQTQDTFSEGLYIDYRHLNKVGIKPRFAFGYGLSYTSFELTEASVQAVTRLSRLPPARPAKITSPIAAMNTTIPAASEVYDPAGFNKVWRYLYSWLSKGDADKAYAIGSSGSSKYPYPAGYSGVQKTTLPPAGGPNGGNPALWDVAYTLSVKVTNTGSKHAGKAVGQVYVQFPQGTSYDTPIIQLRDFAKTGVLAPGASETLQFKLTRRDLSVWDVVEQNWVVPNPVGGYRLWIGQSSGELSTVCYSNSLACESGVASPVV